MPTWENWLQPFQVIEEKKTEPIAKVLGLPSTVREQEWQPTAADRKQAREFYTELRTRITTQPLHYTEGDEPTALKSVADLFAMSRDLIRKGGPEARHFGTLVSFLLNRVVRPFTARWHKELCCGRSPCCGPVVAGLLNESPGPTEGLHERPRSVEVEIILPFA